MRLQEIFERAYENEVFSGVLGVYQDGEPIYEAALGLSDIEKNSPLTVDSRFDLASITKQFTTAAIMLLKDRGLLSVTDEIDKFFPGIPYPGVTVEMLMNHTGGLPDEDWCIQFLTDTGKPIDNDTLLKLIMTMPPNPLFKPGEGWTYSNIAYELLAMIVEQVSGVGFEDFLKNELFLPAGMEHTFIYHRYSGLPPLDHATNSYDYEENRFIEPDKSSSAPFVVPLEGVNGAGLVYTDIRDMAKWDVALRQGRILSEELQAEMRKPVDCEDGRQYGYGWFIEKNGAVVRHSGGWPGYVNHYYRNRENGRMLILLTNMHRDKPALIAMLDELIAAMEEA